MYTYHTNGVLYDTACGSADPDMPIEIPHYTLISQRNTPQEMITPISLYITTHLQYLLSAEFFPQTVKEWNNLPLSVINSDSLLTFSPSLKQ